MSPAIKYTFGRVGLFVVCFLILLPVPLNFLVRAMIALVVSAIASIFLLRRWRTEMAEVISSAAGRRAAEKARLRAALAGDETAATEGDRAADTPPVVDGVAHEATADRAVAREKTERTGAREKAEPTGARERTESTGARENGAPTGARERATPTGAQEGAARERAEPAAAERADRGEPAEERK